MLSLWLRRGGGWWWMGDAPSSLDKRQRQRQRTVQGSAVCVGDKGRQGRDEGCKYSKDASGGQVPESRWSLVKGTGVCLGQALGERATVVVDGRVRLRPALRACFAAAESRIWRLSANVGSSSYHFSPKIPTDSCTRLWPVRIELLRTQTPSCTVVCERKLGLSQNALRVNRRSSHSTLTSLTPASLSFVR